MALNPYPSPESDDDRRKRARLRRSEATSSDSSDAGEFGIFSVRHRVAAPTPHPLPLDAEWDEECQLIDRELDAETLANRARQILSTAGVSELVSVELASRAPYIGIDGPRIGQPTVLIVARWMNEACSAAWERAVINIKKYVDSTRLKKRNLDHLDIAVEIIAEELSLPKYLSPVAAELLSRGMETDWAHIKDKVVEITDSYPATAGHVTSIHLLRLGFSIVDDENPNTVYVSVDYECLETKWPPVFVKIQRYLRRFKYADLTLHLEHNLVEQSAAFPLLPSRRSEAENQSRRTEMNLWPNVPYETRVNLGDDIGASTYVTGSDGNLYSPLIGTLGCWLRIKTVNHPEGLIVALTNYHVIRPAYEGFQIRADGKGQSRVGAPSKPSILWEKDADGIRPSDGAPSIEHPSRSKHNHGVSYRQGLVDQFGVDSPIVAQDKQELDDIVSFFDNGRHVFGKVFCASGFKRRTANNGRLDWALIQPLDDSRIGENRLPTLATWREKYKALDTIKLLPEASAIGGLLQEPTSAGLRGLDQMEPVYKVGTTTTATIGRFSQMKSNISMGEDPHVSPGVSEEFAYVQGGTLNGTFKGCAAFSTRGDSGSVVWDKEGRAVGLLFRGQKLQAVVEETLTYITPIHDVFADIMAFSGGGIKEIRIL
ncbi:hypothetical protein B0T24DRAFT_683361 [Lasiosphaeria ovina]|uniref:Uncharacterized protein n=1 Tax=Lasiosphaeria ovina TaxID=92902 RepID=A0AAE0JVF3_9PEZI|nr:hypothetical protein B0T24DRAFT_683361 [Lasiosphaeria ovina]